MSAWWILSASLRHWPSQAFHREAVLNSNPEMPVQMVLFDAQKDLSIIRLIMFPIFSELLPTDFPNPSTTPAAPASVGNIEACTTIYFKKSAQFKGPWFWSSQMVVGRLKLLYLFSLPLMFSDPPFLFDAMRDMISFESWLNDGHRIYIYIYIILWCADMW